MATTIYKCTKNTIHKALFFAKMAKPAFMKAKGLCRSLKKAHIMGHTFR